MMSGQKQSPRNLIECVYIIYIPKIGLYKVGRTRDLKSRIYGLSLQWDDTPELIYFYQTKSRPVLEAKIHKAIEGKRGDIPGKNHREYFALSTGDIELVKQICEDSTKDVEVNESSHRPLMPPRGVFVPSSILYDKEMPSALRDTYLQILGLSWGKKETPELSVKQLSSLLGKSQATIYGHLASLRDRCALRWRNAGEGTIIVYDFCEAVLNSRELESPVNIKVLNLESLDSIIKESKENRQENKDEPIAPATTESAMSLYREVTGHFTFPPGQYMATRIEIIQGLLRKYGHDGALERLRAAWVDWQNRRRKDNGLPYSGINTSWIDYAMADELPGGIQSAAQINSDGSLNV